jgi:hypothetical protein
MNRVHPVSTWRALLAFAVLAACSPASAIGIRCGNRVIGTNMIEAQVRSACGAPFWSDGYGTLEIFGAGSAYEEQREVNWDVWYYNFGPRNLMQRLTFRDGRLQQVDALGYGFDETGSACVPAIAARGITSGELVARCGEPVSRQRSDGARVRRLPGYLRADEDRREEWIYDDGSQYLTRYLITNGTVQGVDRLPR